MLYTVVRSEMRDDIQSASSRHMRKKFRVVCVVRKTENREYNNCGFDIFNVWCFVITLRVEVIVKLPGI